uniref:Sushi domain-containing protein n=1 Tax=Chelonoidis abingdonii TaxID=106734 RepID=A0A8C0HAI0_CHEAB
METLIFMLTFFASAIPCPPPPGITRGSHTGQSGREFIYGSAVTYKCDKGVSLIGAASIHCTTKDKVNGVWSGPAPECKVVRCREPEVEKGKKQSGFGPDYSYGNTVIFECDSGYTLKGSIGCGSGDGGVHGNFPQGWWDGPGQAILDDIVTAAKLLNGSYCHTGCGVASHWRSHTSCIAYPDSHAGQPCSVGCS